MSTLPFRPDIQQRAAYLRTLPSIRERCGRVHDLAKDGKLEYFEYHPEKEADVAKFCVEIMKRDFGTDFASIPPHGRWRHLDAGTPRIAPLLSRWAGSLDSPSPTETCKRLVDLFLVSVLLDAGAGNVWSYNEKETGMRFTRSEGLGVASVKMFEEGMFSGVQGMLYRVDAEGLAKVTKQQVALALQVSEANLMVGLEGRTSLLTNLSTALKANPQFFGQDSRPGNLVDFLEDESIMDGPRRRVPIASLWHALIYGLSPIWPTSRTSLGGVSLGDVWPCAALTASLPLSSAQEGENLVPFHKLTGWITYSLIEPMQKILGWEFEGVEDMTGLPEYRNGGLLLDLGVLTLRPGKLKPDPATGLPRIPPSHPAIIEWRAMTVIELDRIADLIRQSLGLTAQQLTLAQVLESATWKGGREIAKVKRRETGGPPIDIESDGTVF